MNGVLAEQELPINIGYLYLEDFRCKCVRLVGIDYESAALTAELRARRF